MGLRSNRRKRRRGSGAGGGVGSVLMFCLGNDRFVSFFLFNFFFSRRGTIAGIIKCVGDHGAVESMLVLIVV